MSYYSGDQEACIIGNSISKVFIQKLSFYCFRETYTPRSIQRRYYILKYLYEKIARVMWAFQSHRVESPLLLLPLLLDSKLFPLIAAAAATAAKSLQLCPTLWDPIDGSPRGSHVPGILQARTLEWIAISFSNAWKWKVKVKSLSCVQLVATPRTAAYQAPPSMGFSRQEYWSGVPRVVSYG